MGKKGFNYALTLFAAGMMLFLSASGSSAFQSVSIGNTDLEIYGFLRNNYGYFIENQDYTLNNDKLATNRTWLRTNIDWRFSDSLSMFASTQFVYEPSYKIEEGSVSQGGGKEYSEYDDINDVLREAYFDWSPNSNHSFRIGRQIVIWGESVTVKVGDVVNPEDTRFTFGFANWEDTRIPQYMVKGLHYFDNISSSLEWIFSPNLVGDEYRVNRSGEYAIPAAGEMASQRFALHPEDRFLPPYAVGNDFYAGIGVFPAGAINSSPLSRGWVYSPYAPGNGWMSTEIPNVKHDYPDQDDFRFGFRTSTFLGGYEFGVSYYHTQSYDPVMKRTDRTYSVPGADLPMRDYYLTHPDLDYIGAYFNKNASLGVFRGEAIYSPNKPYNTFDTSVFDAIVKRDYVKYMLAWDITGRLYFDWHKSAPFDITLEHIGEFVPDNEDVQNVIYGTELKSYKPSIGGRITTNWFYNLIETELIASYGFKGRDGLIMPVVTWMPPWMDKAFSAELRYIGIFGDNNYEDLGMFKQKDMVVLTTQFNF